MRLPIFSISVLILCLVVSGPALADFYQWEDESGNVHITDYPPPPTSAAKIKIHRDNAAAPAAPRNPAPTARPKATENRNRRTDHEVILYTTSWCSYCKKARDFFNARGIRYTEYDIEKDRHAAETMRKLSGRSGVPFAIVNQERISGYAPEAYDAALRKNE
ncbi:MAG: glutaredoxin family protein [Smithellaceae bacterium]